MAPKDKFLAPPLGMGLGDMSAYQVIGLVGGSRMPLRNLVIVNFLVCI